MSYAKPPILTGSGKSDYENYLRTDELLSLQKNSDQWEHRDELLFTIVHQTSELWLKLAANEICEATLLLRKLELRESMRLLPRVIICFEQVLNSLNMLQKMSPWDYQKVRRALGHGSGFDSPGFNEVRKRLPELGSTFFHSLEARGIEVIQLFLQDREQEDLFQIGEMLLEIDAKIAEWRFRHYQVVARTIGESVSGTQGTPVETLAKMLDFRFFPRLWLVRAQLTELADSRQEMHATVVQETK